MPASTTGTLTTTGSVALNKPSTDTLTQIQLSGTYGTVTGVIEGQFDGSAWFPLAAVDASTAGVASGTLSPADNSTLLYNVPSAGLSGVRFRSTAVASGTLAVAIQSGAFVGIPPVATTNNTTFGATSFSGNITMADATNVVLNTSTGTKIGTAVTQKLGFWNATPIVQPSGAAQAAVAGTAATNSSPYGYSQAQADAIVTLVNALRTALVNAGIIKGSA
jgi:hypothetical protein